MWSDLRYRVRALFGRERVERDLEDELHFHLTKQVEKGLRAGLSPEEAMRRARLSLGGLEQEKERTRDARGTRPFEDLLQDLRYAVRVLRRSPGFTLAVVLTLGLGIGAATAIFSVVDAALLRPLAVREPDQLFTIHERIPKFSHLAPVVPVSLHHYHEWRRHTDVFEEMAVVGALNLTLTGAGEPEQLSAARASASLFPLLGVAPRIGRTFTDAEARVDHDDVVVISDPFWRRRFASDPAVVGRTLTLDGRPHQIIGVLPPHFALSRPDIVRAMPDGQDPVEIWKPFAVRDYELQPFGGFNFAALVRLRAGVSPAQAEAALDAVLARISAAIPPPLEMHAHLIPVQQQMGAPHRQGLLLLLTAVGVVLLIACVNIANLLLARHTGRRQELAIRTALGASRGRLIGQLLAESLVLAAAGGLLGVMVGETALRGLLVYAPADLPRLDEVRLDGRALLFTLIISTAAGLLAGLLPAWRFSRAQPQDALQASGSRRATEGRGGRRLRAWLVGAEVSLSVLCLVAAGLLMQSFLQLMRVDGGFNADRVLTVALRFPPTRYAREQDRTRFLDHLIAGVRTQPGVVSASISNLMPLAVEGNNNVIAVEGRPVPLGERAVAEQRFVSPDHFRTLGIPLLAGRLFSEDDRPSGSGQRRFYALVSAATARRLWPSESPIGRRFQMGPAQSAFFEVIGVVGEVHATRLDRPPDFAIYLPYWDRNLDAMSLAVRTAHDPLGAAEDVRRTIRALDPELPIPQIETMTQRVDATLAPRRFQLTLVAVFAGAALLLATIGIYAVVAYSVGQRRNELGVRLALGASPAAVRRLVIRDGLAPVWWGLAAGAAGGVAVGRLMRSLLYGLSGTDALTLASVALLLLIVAAAACWLPARRAARLDPLTALRCD